MKSQGLFDDGKATAEFDAATGNALWSSLDESSDDDSSDDIEASIVDNASSSTIDISPSDS